MPITSSHSHTHTRDGSASTRVRHFVTFRYRCSEDRAAVITRFLALQQECVRPPSPGSTALPYIVSIETGKATSHEGIDQGMVDGFLVTFKSEEDHNFYIDDDEIHKKFQRFVSSKLDREGVFVFDFTVERSASNP
jgi:hypothetical protein